MVDPKQVTDAPAQAPMAVPPPVAPPAPATLPSKPVVQQQQKSIPPPAVQSSGKTTHGSIFPIEGLSPYQNSWTIKARVTQKSDIKTWSNNRGEGKLFNVTLMDDTGEIRGTGFNLAVDELYPKLEEGKVYYISKARVNLAKKKFSNLTNDYELNFDRNTEVEEVCVVSCDGSAPNAVITSATRPPTFPWSSITLSLSVVSRIYQKTLSVVRSIRSPGTSYLIS